MPHIVAKVTLIDFIVRVLEYSIAILLDVLVLADIADTVRPLINAKAFLPILVPFAVVGAAVGPSLRQETFHPVVLEQASIVTAIALSH